MPPVQFAIQSYESRTLPLSAQQLVNLYAEAPPQDAKSQVVLYGTPGIKTFCDNLGDGPIRGMHVMDGLLYVMSGNILYKVDNRCNAFPVGSIEKGGAGDPGVCMGAVANFRITAGSAGGGNQITSIKINGDEILGSAVTWTTSNVETENLIAAEINNTTTIWQGKTSEGGVGISAPDETGGAFAGAVVEITTTGDVQVDNATPPMGGGFCMPGDEG